MFRKTTRTHSTHTSSRGYTYWLEACLRNSSSVCLKVSKRHLFTVFSTLITSPVTEGTRKQTLQEGRLASSHCRFAMTKNNPSPRRRDTALCPGCSSLASVKARHPLVPERSTRGANRSETRAAPRGTPARPPHLPASELAPLSPALPSR